MKDIQRSYSETPNKEYPLLNLWLKEKEQTKLLFEWLHKSK